MDLYNDLPGTVEAWTIERATDGSAKPLWQRPCASQYGFNLSVCKFIIKDLLIVLAADAKTLEVVSFATRQVLHQTGPVSTGIVSYSPPLRKQRGIATAVVHWLCPTHLPFYLALLVASYTLFR